MEDKSRTDYRLVTVGDWPAGLTNPETGVYTTAVRCEPPRQPVSSFPRPLSKHWSE